MNGGEAARDEGWRRGGGHAGNTDGPTARRALTHWPLPVGDVQTRRGLTFVSSAEPGGFSVDDLRRIPDDGRRVELLKGVLVVRPPLTPGQRQLIRNLCVRLCDTCPERFTAVERRDVRLGEATVFRPDIQVVPRDEDDGTFPEIVVELRPDDTDSDERRTKMRGYRDVGIPSYWIVDPEKARVAVYELKYTKRDTLLYRCEEVCERPVDRTTGASCAPLLAGETRVPSVTLPSGRRRGGRGSGAGPARGIRARRGSGRPGRADRRPGVAVGGARRGG